MLDNASATISNAISAPFSFFGLPPPTSPTMDDVRESDIDLREDELVERDWGDSEELDDSPDLQRAVRVIPVDIPGAMDNTDASAELELSLAARERRIWEILPIRSARASNVTRR